LAGSSAKISGGDEEAERGWRSPAGRLPVYAARGQAKRGAGDGGSKPIRPVKAGGHKQKL